MRSKTFAAIAVVAGISSPGLAAAAPGDPEPGSPPGSMYEVPLEGGRGDAAPHPTGAPGSGGGGGPAPSSDADAPEVAAEGSSGPAAPAGSPASPAAAPSATETAAAADETAVPASEGDSASSGTPDETAGSLYRSENNFGSSSHVPGDPRAGSAAAARPDAVDSGNTSTATALGLVGTFILAGLLAGLFATVRRRKTA